MAITYKDGTVKYVGRVLELNSTNGPSWGADRTYAKVWLDDKHDWGQVTIREVYGDWGNEHIVSDVSSFEVDATPEVIKAYKEQEQDRAAKAAELRWLERNLKDALTVGKGKRVKVVKGKKVDKGTVGIVKWIGENNWGVLQVGMKVEGETRLVYTAASNAEVILPDWWTPVDYADDVRE